MSEYHPVIKTDINKQSKEFETLVKSLSATQNIQIVPRESLHDFVGEEYERYWRFRRYHYRKCKNGNEFIITLSGTGIGECITVKCPVCGQEEDITDTGVW